MNLGMKLVGKIGLMALVLLVWTDAKAFRHNAAQVHKGTKALYPWEIKSIRDPTPSMILVLK
jgi:hypothetical protein|tara:strand:- start:132 stop:317 length:186 start_codon:yes stop_codon:yes gene_type:complete